MSSNKQTIIDLIGEIKKPTAFININWIDDIQYREFEEFEYKDHVSEIIGEYILTNDVKNILEEFLQTFLKRIKASDEDKVNIKINNALRGEYGTGKSHLLTFLSLILVDNEDVQNLIENRLDEDKNRYNDLKKVVLELREELKDNFLICPIKLTDYDNELKLHEIIKHRLQDIAIQKYKDDNIRLVSIYMVLDWFMKLDDQFKELIFLDLDKNSRDKIKNTYKEDLYQLDLEELNDIQKKIINLYELKTKTKISINFENIKLSDEIKNSDLYKKYNTKNILIILDELTQWWGSRNEADLINQLHGIVEDFISCKEMNISLIFSYQKAYSSSDFLTFKERLKSVWILESLEFKDIIPKRCLNKDKLKNIEIERLSLSYANLIFRDLKISKNVLDRLIFFNPNIKYKNIIEGLTKYFKLYYPFHPSVFLLEIWQIIGKFSTQLRGGMNIILELLEKNQYCPSNEILLIPDEISEILSEILEVNHELGLLFRNVIQTLNIKESSLEYNILILLSVFPEKGLTVEEMNLFLLKDVGSTAKRFYKELIANNIEEIKFESSSQKYMISFDSKINIDTHINNFNKLIDDENILNYLQYYANNENPENSFFNHRENSSETFNYMFLRNIFFNVDDFNIIKNDIHDLLEERENEFNELSEKPLYFGKFLDTSIPDGYIVFFKPNFQNAMEYINNNFKQYRKIIFAKFRENIEFRNNMIYETLRINLIFDILTFVANSETDKFEDFFQEFENHFQNNEMMLNFNIISDFKKPLQDFYEICKNNSVVILAEIDNRRRNIQKIDDKFWNDLFLLYKYYYNGEEFENYLEMIQYFESKIFPNRLEPIPNFSPTTINHLLKCLTAFEDYKPRSNPEKETLSIYKDIGMLKSKSGKFYVNLDFKKPHIKIIKNFILDKLTLDPIKIKEIIYKLRHSEYGMNMEFSLISIIALLSEGSIKLLQKKKGDKFEDYPKEKDRNNFCNKINKLNSLINEKYYIQAIDLVKQNDWRNILNYLKFLKDHNICSELSKFEIDPMYTNHNGNTEREILFLYKSLSLNKIALIEANFIAFMNKLGKEEEDFVFGASELEKVKNIINELNNLTSLKDINNYLNQNQNIDKDRLSHFLSFFDREKKYKKIINNYKKLKNILGD